MWLKPTPSTPTAMILCGQMHNDTRMSRSFGHNGSRRVPTAQRIFGWLGRTAAGGDLRGGWRVGTGAPHGDRRHEPGVVEHLTERVEINAASPTPGVVAPQPPAEQA